MTVHVSLRKRQWDIPKIDGKRVDALIAQGANALNAPILAARGHEPEDVQDFLAPSLREYLPNPLTFIEMDLAAGRIVKAITQRQKIAIWSDYDVDGATSGALLETFLEDIGHPSFATHIPDRIKEGYGPNAPGLLDLQARGADLVVILDSGTSAIEALDAAREANLDVVVIDHHDPGPELPVACALVNPNRKDQPKGYGHICAVGMTFLSIVEINRQLRLCDWFDGQQRRPNQPPDLMSYLDLVALGTVCDVVPLKNVNRAFVTRGLDILSARRRPGIAALAEAAACKNYISARDCGFGLGPRINAAGRIGQPDLGLRLLCCKDIEEAREIAAELNTLNSERQDMEKQATADAIAQLEDRFIPGETRAIAIATVDAHEGIVGISAARVKEAFDVPAFVLAPTEKGLLKGSGRSVPGFNLGGAIIAARAEGLLVAGGGHAMAGGVTLKPDQLEAFETFVNDRIAESDYAQEGVVTRVDIEIQLSQATTGMVDAMEALAPFGTENPPPRFAITHAKISRIVVLKDKHLKCIFEDPEMGPSGPQLEGLLWNAVGTPLGQEIQSLEGCEVEILGALEINEWNGRRRVQIKIEDMRRPEGAA